MRAYSLEVGVPAHARPAAPATPVNQAPIASNAAAPAEPAHLSIVVLPFANLSGDPEQSYFADAIADDLTTDLSHLAESFVIARNTPDTNKGKAVDVRAVGRELGVRYALEGSVRRVGETITVNAQLISTETGAHVLGGPLRRRPGAAWPIAGGIRGEARALARCRAYPGREPARDT
jgi:TolB-like protein